MGLGERLKQAREEKGFTQIFVAKKLNITNTALSNYERGERDPDTPLLNKLSVFYGVSTDWLLGNENNSLSANNKTVDSTTDPEFTDLLYRVKDLTEEEKKSLKEHWEWSMGVIEEERQKRKKFKEKFGGGEPGGK